jgi:menaquinol-cytochrome c reductase iron-sulfur subunit
VLRRRPNKVVVQRVARLRELVPGKPVQVSVLGSRHDAWTLHPEEVIGRVWLVRGKGRLGAEQQPKVTALTSICPHLGCAVQLDARGQNFVCPCHRAAFGLDGQKISERQLGQPNHAPRGMDSLDCRLVRDEGDDDWWVEVNYERFEQGLTKKVSKA